VPAARPPVAGAPAFERHSRWYDPLARPYGAPLLALAMRELPTLGPGARVLDLGCGPGAELAWLARRPGVREVVGVDQSGAMVDRARAVTPATVGVWRADAAALPSEVGGRFDLVIAVLSYHHFPDAASVTREARRMLRAGGALAVVDHGPEWAIRLLAPLSRAADPGFVGHLAPAELARLMLDAGFDRCRWIPLALGVGCALGEVDPR